MINPNEHQWDTNSGKLLAKEEVFQIVGCAIEVLISVHSWLVQPIEERVRHSRD
jgi:hypothetical protein